MYLHFKSVGAADRCAVKEYRSRRSRNQYTTNRQAEPAAPVTPADGTVGLDKRREDRRLFVRGKADPRIVDPETKANSIAGPLQYLHLHGYPAMLGEFNCVAAQVDKHLPQPERKGDATLLSYSADRKFM